MTTQGHIVVGTAGHIDHGKTALVRSLTGVDTDRLKEEKERGITIELGFAPLTLPSGKRLGLVDVPGHERFVRNMVAGATGIDLVVLVIAADEGVMPQTREHLDICSLLGTRGGIVALTKVDLVDADWQEMVTDDVREYLAGTFLQNAPIIPFSAVTGAGRDELLSALESMAAEVPGRMPSGIFRLPVDRVFTMKGFGSVVTGTLISGKVSVGDEVLFYPGGHRGKVRGLQVHGEAVPSSSAGTRTAINLQGTDRSEVARGETAAHPDTLLTTYLLDARVSLLASAARPLKNRDRVRLHLFTSEVMTRVVLLDSEILDPGKDALIQLRLEEPAVAMPGDRFVLRSYSPVTTIGGGVVLDPAPPKHRRGRKAIVERLARLQTHDPAERMRVYLEEAAEQGTTVGLLAPRSGLLPGEALRLAGELEAGGEAVISGEGAAALVYSAAAFDRLKDRLVKSLEKFHGANPLKTGMGREELRTRVARELSDRPYRNLLAALEAKGIVSVDRDTVRLRSHSATLTPEQEALSARVLSRLAADGLSAPFLAEMAEALGTDPTQLKAVLSLLTERGEIVRVKDDYFVSLQSHQSLLDGIEEYFGRREELSLADFRDIAGTTRKWMIPLLEYLDRVQVTMRKGDVRIRRGKTPSGG